VRLRKSGRATRLPLKHNIQHKKRQPNLDMLRLFFSSFLVLFRKFWDFARKGSASVSFGLAVSKPGSPAIIAARWRIVTPSSFLPSRLWARTFLPSRDRRLRRLVFANTGQRQKNIDAPHSKKKLPAASLIPPVGVGECGRNPLADVRLLPPAGYAVVGALLRCPLPLDLLRSLLVVSPSFPIRRFPVPSLRTFDG
jgi:hypothetical protein